MWRGPLHARLVVSAVLFAFLAWAHAWHRPALAANTPAANTAALRARAETLFEQRSRSSTAGGVDMDALRADLIALADQLEAAHLDSLATDARIEASRVLIRMGRRTDAEQQLNYGIADALRARDPLRQMRCRIQLADTRIPTDPALGLRTIEEALPAARALHNDEILGDSYSTQAHALVELGRFDEGLIASRRAAAHYVAAGNEHEQLLSLCQCSQCLRFLGRHPEARAITDSVLTRARATKDGLVLSRALVESASMYRTTRRYPEALAAISEAIALDQQRGDVSRGRNSRMTRARLYLQMGKPAECAADLDTMLASPDVQRSLSLLVRLSALQARALVSLGRAREADSLLANATARYERYRSGLANEEDRAGIGEHAVEAYMAWTRVKLALGRPEEGWQTCERARGVTLESRLGVADVPALAALRARLAQTRSALLEYDSADPVVGNVFVVWGGGVRGFPMKTSVLVGDLHAVLDAASLPGAGSSADSAAARLAVALFTDVAPWLGSEIEHLIVIPPSRMETLPFEYLPLPGSTPARTIGERFAVTYVASAGTLLALDQRAVPPRGITVLADPVVDANQQAIASLDPGLRGTVLRPLPGARQEAQLLAGPGTTLLLGRDATLARLLAAPPAALLHFATHAFDDAASASRGGLVLAGADPMLTPARLESLTVRADLVTLSGCGTLGSTAYSGEGTFGLARAFLASGSRSVISTRWNVSDRGAAHFMEAFYANLRSGMPRDQSLSKARTRLRAEGYGPRDCWAFMLSGVGDRPLPQWTSGGTSAPVRK